MAATFSHSFLSDAAQVVGTVIDCCPAPPLWPPDRLGGNDADFQGDRAVDHAANAILALTDRSAYKRSGYAGFVYAVERPGSW
jgi:hypothetical protein